MRIAPALFVVPHIPNLFLFSAALVGGQRISSEILAQCLVFVHVCPYPSVHKAYVPAHRHATSFHFNVLFAPIRICS
uniref:Putative secreted protein n=1 Tax=Ixodes ricinus TaxID=34613 RepID=A0A6B0U044_IXORI